MKSKLIPALLITISLSGLLVFVALNSIQSTHTSTKDNSTDTNYTHPSLQTIIIERSQKQETEQNDPDKKNEENQKATNQENKNKKPKHHWGVDSASYTSQDFYKCVVDNFGKPIFWGRYLEDKDGVSKGLTKEEVKLLHDNDIKIMPIFNHFTDATGYDNGVAEAKVDVD